MNVNAAQRSFRAWFYPAAALLAAWVLPLAASGENSSGSYPVHYTDAYGLKVVLREPPRRVISLAPSVTEIFLAMGLRDRLAAVTDYCEWPEGGGAPPRAGRLDAPNRERIIQIWPALVAGTVLTPKHVYRQLEAAGLTVAAFDHGSLDEVLRDIRALGELMDEESRARHLIQKIEIKRRAILGALEKIKEKPPARAVLLYDLDGLFSAGKHSWPGDMIELCHAVNLAASAPSSWPRLSLEKLAADNPEVIIAAVPEDTSAAVLEKARALSRHPVWKHVTAVKNGRVELLDARLFNIPGPRMIEALEALARALHPEAFNPGSGSGPAKGGRLFPVAGGACHSKTRAAQKPEKLRDK